MKSMEANTDFVSGEECDVGASTSQGNLKFPFFDLADQDQSMSRSYIVEKRSSPAPDNLFTPSSKRRHSNCRDTISPMTETKWDTEISPIAKTRDSDCSGVVLDISSNDPIGGNILQTPDKDPGEDIDSMLSELKDIIQKSQQKQKARSRISSIGLSSSIHGDNDFQLEKLTAQPTPPPKPKVENHIPVENESHEREAFSDLSDARKQVDQSSNNFIEYIRDAAHKRKVAMTRSRDDLKAKEREQLEVNAASKQAGTEESNNDVQSQSTPDTSSCQSKDSNSASYRFKARPVPATTGIKGMGGLNGVPKVAKRPTTTPFSPLLGPRRRQQIKVKALEEPKMKRKIQEEQPSLLTNKDKENVPKVLSKYTPSFKARPVPAFIGRKGQGGLTGVPKVQKRSVTVPKSPMLGARRQSKAQEEGKKRNLEISRQSPSFSQSPAHSLIGLGLLEPTPDQKNLPLESENRIYRSKYQAMPFQLHSTSRAKKRAEYDVRRDVNTKRRMEMDSKMRDTEIRKMHKELKVMSRSLS